MTDSASGPIFGTWVTAARNHPAGQLNKAEWEQLVNRFAEELDPDCDAIIHSLPDPHLLQLWYGAQWAVKDGMTVFRDMKDATWAEMHRRAHQLARAQQITNAVRPVEEP